MKKRVVLTLIGCALLLTFTVVVAYVFYSEWKNEQCYRVELYERETYAFHEYFEIRRLNGGDIDFNRLTVDKEGGAVGHFSAGADYVGDNIWVFDTSQALPEGATVYKFIITEDGLEFYIDEERTYYSFVSSHDYVTDESAFEGEVELYVSESQCLKVIYHDDGNILFELSEKGEPAFCLNTAERTEHNVWIYDSTKASDEDDVYYKLVKHITDSSGIDYIEMYDANGAVTRFEQIV